MSPRAWDRACLSGPAETARRSGPVSASLAWMCRAEPIARIVGEQFGRMTHWRAAVLSSSKRRLWRRSNSRYAGGRQLESTRIVDPPPTLWPRDRSADFDAARVMRSVEILRPHVDGMLVAAEATHRCGYDALLMSEPLSIYSRRYNNSDFR